jgi:diadenosine tetraphosphate (Ap4A) HIT family hydrolase
MNYKYILIAIFVLVQLCVSYAGVEKTTEGTHTARQSLLIRLPEDLQKEMLTKWLDDDVKNRATLDTAHTNTVDRPELEKVCKENVAVSLLFDSKTSQYTSLDQIMDYIDNKYKNINKLKIRFDLLKRIDPETISKIKSLQINFDTSDLVWEFGYDEEALYDRIEEESALLSSANNLEEFTLHCAEEVYDRICPILENIPHTTITKLSLIGKGVEDSYDRTVIETLCMHTQLEELHVVSRFLYPQYFEFEEDNLEYALDNPRFLTREFSKLVKLRSLTINSLGNFSQFTEFTVNNGMFDFLRNNKVLEKLNLESVFLSKNSLNSIVSCINLKELTLSYFTKADLVGDDNYSIEPGDKDGYNFLTPEEFIDILNGSELDNDLKLTIHSASFFPEDSFDSLLLRFPNAEVFRKGTLRQTMNTFTVDERLLNNTEWVADLPLSSLFLQNDTRYPWFVLVPRIADMTEMYQLDQAHQAQLMTEISLMSRYLKEELSVHKVNVGALGNVVPQLHIHVLGRDPSDSTWPNPVWGVGTAERYTADALQESVQHAQQWVMTKI